MKYKAIYDVIYNSDGTIMTDRSRWQKGILSMEDKVRPLWIILENRRVNLRLWVTHEYGELRITTAQLDLDCNSREYSESHKQYRFRKQSEMAECVRKILNGEK